MIDFDNLTPDELEAYAEQQRAKTPPTYLGVIILWVLDLGFIALGAFLLYVVTTSTITGSWLPLAIVFAICGGAVLLVPLLVKWTRGVAPARAAWEEKYGRGRA